MPMPGDFPGASRWGYLITDDKKAKPPLKNLYKAIVNHIVSLELRTSLISLTRYIRT